MGAVNSYEDLIVWREAMELAVATYHETASFPREERFGLRAQIRDAAASVASNIAEGHSRGKTGPYLLHLSISSGSLGELATRVELARRLRFLSDAAAARLVHSMRRVGPMLGALIRSLARHKGRQEQQAPP